MKKILLTETVRRKRAFSSIKRYALLLIFIFSAISSQAFDLFDKQLRNFKIKNVNIKDAIEYLLQDSGYKLTYSVRNIQNINNVSLDLNNVTLEVAMEKLLKEHQLTYTILDNNIVISKTSADIPAKVAQQKKRTINGKVIDASTKKSLSGATVIVTGTQIGAITDGNGSFIINNINETAKLEVSTVGYKPTIVDVTAAKNNYVIELQVDAINMEDVVVVAYGTAKKNSITGSVAIVNTDRIESAKVSNISQALQGTSPGIQSVSSSGQPGTEATIRIRGIGSVNASSDPLYVLDGVPYSGSINSINPTDIQSISVLKDAASSALYGSRGANGVIIITTKQGRMDVATKVNVTASYGVSSRATRDYDQLSTDEYYTLYWEALRNGLVDKGNAPALAASKASETLVSAIGINPYGSKFPQPVGVDGKLMGGAVPLYEGDWAGALIKMASRGEVNVNITGGSKTASYYASAGYLNDEGIAITSGFERFTSKLNGTFKPKSWLTLTLGLSGTYSDQNAPKADDSNLANVIIHARGIPSFYPVYQVNENGQYIDSKGNPTTNDANRVYDFGDYRKTSYKGYNLAATMPDDLSQVIRYAVSSRMGVNIDLYKGLSFKTSFAFDLNDRTGKDFRNSIQGPSAKGGGSASRSISKTSSWTLNNILNYSLELNKKNTLDFLVGQEAYKYNYLSTSGSVSSFPISNISEPSAASIVGGFSGASDIYTLIGYLGQVKYAFDEKYNLSASIRTDGSSRFHKDNRWGTFWSVGASWDISKEKFLTSSNLVDRMIVKASYGAQGNDNLSTYYAYQQLYSLGKNNNIGTATLSRLATPDLKWESNLNLNLGIDYSLFSNRVSGTFEYFSRASKDLLFNLPIAPSLGFSGYDANVGSMSNSGIEVDLRVVVLRKSGLEWSVNANLTHYKSKLTSLPRTEIISGTKRMIIGSSIYDFWMKEYAGTAKTEESVIKSISGGKVTEGKAKGGEPLWYYTGEDGVKRKTSSYDGASYDYFGSSLPDFYGGFGTELRYRNIQFSALFAYSVGGKILDQDAGSLLGTGTGPGSSWSVRALDRWTPENQNTDYPRLSTEAYTKSWTNTSTQGLVNASYLRLKNCTITYNLGESLLNKLKISKASVYVQGENLFTLFGTQGLDPEISGITGVSYFRYPIMRTISVGLNLSF